MVLRVSALYCGGEEETCKEIHQIKQPNKCKKISARSNLKFIWYILLVERIQAHEFETLGYDVEGLVVSFGAQRHLISADLQKTKPQTFVFVSQTSGRLYNMCRSNHPHKNEAFGHRKQTFVFNKTMSV